MAQTKAAPRLMMDARGAVVALQCDQHCPLSLVIEPGGHLMTVNDFMLICHYHSLHSFSVLWIIDGYVTITDCGCQRGNVEAHNVERYFKVMHTLRCISARVCVCTGTQQTYLYPDIFIVQIPSPDGGGLEFPKRACGQAFYLPQHTLVRMLHAKCWVCCFK